MGMRACSLLGVRAGRLRRGVRARVLPAEPREDGRAPPPSRRSRTELGVGPGTPAGRGEPNV